MVFGVREPARLRAQPAEGASTGAVLKQALRQLDHNSLLLLLTILFYSMAYYAIEAGLSSFAVFGLGISPGATAIYGGIGALVFLLFALPAGLLGARYDRRRVMMVGLAGLTVLFLMGYVVIQDGTTLAVMLVIFGVLWALVNVNGLPFLFDLGDERYLGAYTGFYYFCSQLAAVLGPTTGGLLVDWWGNQYRPLFLFSALFLALAWLALGRIPPLLAQQKSGRPQLQQPAER
jgi:MFS family permease